MTAVSDYIAALERAYRRGDATEHSYRPALQKGGPAYPVTGDHVVEKVRYEPGRDGSSGKVWINPRQYFEGIDADTFAFRVGGYQALEKWLKDRKGRQLSRDEIEHYRKIAIALARTRELMTQVDVAAAPLFAPAAPEPEPEPAGAPA